MSPNWISCLAVGALVFNGACTTPAAPVSPANRPLTTIKVADVPQVVQAPFYIAIDQGYFRAEGLEVELVPSSTAADAATLVATSQVDYAGIGPDPALFNAMQRGIDVQILGATAVLRAGTRASGIVVRQDYIDSGRYAEPRDLKGMRIAVGAAQSRFYAERILARAGLTAADVEFVTLAPPAMVAALQTKAIDAAWEVEPLVAQMQSQHLGTLTSTGFEALPGGVPWLVARSGSADNGSQAISTGLMRAVVRGMRDFYHAFNASDGPSAPSISALAAHSSVKDIEVLKKVGMHTVDPNGAFEAAALDAYQDYYLQTGEQMQRVDLSAHIDRRPLESALSTLGGV
jgi:ABC-type nitrate/sulfonate/bicarbonate transport system substrate-binding protein